MTIKNETAGICECGHKLQKEHKRRGGARPCSVPGDDPRTTEPYRGALTCKCPDYRPVQDPNADEGVTAGGNALTDDGKEPNDPGYQDRGEAYFTLTTPTLPPIGRDNEIGRLADVARESGYFADKTPAQLAIIMLAGEVIGASPINALFDLDVIDGRLKWKGDPSYTATLKAYEDHRTGGDSGDRMPESGKVVSIKVPGQVREFKLDPGIEIQAGDVLKFEGGPFDITSELSDLPQRIVGPGIAPADGIIYPTYQVTHVRPQEVVEGEEIPDGYTFEFQNPDLAIPGVLTRSDEPPAERPLPYVESPAADPSPESVEARAESETSKAKATPVRDFLERQAAEAEERLRPRDDENRPPDPVTPEPASPADNTDQGVAIENNAARGAVVEGTTAEAVTGTRADWRIEIEAKLFELGFNEQKIKDKLAVFDAETREDLLRQKIVSCRALYRTKTTDLKAKAFKILADDGKHTEDQRRGFYMFCNVPGDSDSWTYKDALTVYETAGGEMSKA